MKILSFNKFNESLESNSDIETIKEAFLSLTDAYPLDVEFKIVEKNENNIKTYLVIIKFLKSFCDINHNVEIHRDIIDKVKISKSYLLNTFNIKNTYPVANLASNNFIMLKLTKK